tara:strand:- start:312 stop:1403 length:1092 start_codon:yes stop_codon:yes gene_type:complete
MRQQLADATSEFVGKRHSLTLRQTPRWAQSLVIILTIFGGSTLLASYLIKIDEVITVSGSLRPLGGAREVLAPVTANLANVEVADGDSVQKDQILAIYDTRNANIRKKNLEEQLSLAKKSLSQNLDLLEIEKEALSRAYIFSEDIAARYKKLAELGASSEINQLSQEKGLEDMRSQLARLDKQKTEIQLQYDQRIKGLTSDLSQVQLLLNNSIIKSPISGVVFDLDASANQVATLGKPLMKLVPSSATKAEVFVSNRDIGFVQVGQDARVRVDAYPYTKFGDLNGKVSRIGADALEPDATNPSYRFPVTIKLNAIVLNSNGRNLPLKPGMSVQANLRLREKRLISIVTDLFSRNVEGLKSLRD